MFAGLLLCTECVSGVYVNYGHELNVNELLNYMSKLHFLRVVNLCTVYTFRKEVLKNLEHIQHT